MNNKEEIKLHLDKKEIPYHILESSDEQDRINECKILAKNISKLIKDKEINDFLTKVLVIYGNYITEQNIILKNYQRQFSDPHPALDPRSPVDW